MGDSPRSEPRQSAGPFQLPSIAAMTRGLPKGDSSPEQKHGHVDMMRDSGMWSMQSPSKHSSTISSATAFSSASSNRDLHLQTILNQDDSQRYSQASSTPASARFSRDQPSTLPNLNGDNRASLDANNTSFLDSRRSSIDSRVGVHVGHYSQHSHQSSSSPYQSHNASQTSLPGHTSPNSTASMGPPPQPAQRPSVFANRRPVTASGHVPKRAPVIQPNPRSGDAPDPLAATPTKGYAWAFPGSADPEDKDDSTMTPDSSRHGSLASSLRTQESLPWMKHEPPLDPHHGPLQHRSISNLQSHASAMGTGNYSRTPELRVSHKLAERKRRSEMKDLFEDLNHRLPNAPGSKASKWETLSKAIDYIGALKQSHDGYRDEADKLRSEIEHLKGAADEAQLLQSELSMMHQHLLRVDPNGHHVFGPKTRHLEDVAQQNQGGRMHVPSTPTSYGAMQGVEYGGHGGYERR